MDQSQWADKQWNQFYSKAITIGLDFFESLTTAVELVSSGARLKPEEREKWQTTLEHCHERMDQEIEAIK